MLVIGPGPWSGHARLQFTGFSRRLVKIVSLGTRLDENTVREQDDIDLVSQARSFPFRSADRFQSERRILKAIGAAERKGSGLRD